MVESHATAVLDMPLGDMPTGDKPLGDKPVRGLGRNRQARPTPVQSAWLKRGLAQPGDKLPLFDDLGQHYNPRTIRSCVDQGWAEPWIGNPLKPDWLVCKLTAAGRRAVTNGA